MKFPDPLIIEAQGMQLRASTIIIMAFDAVVAALTPNQKGTK